MNRYNWEIWILRIITIAMGVILGYLMGAMEHSGTITDCITYCEEAMP